MIQAGHLLLELSDFALRRLALTLDRAQRATQRLAFRLELHPGAADAAVSTSVRKWSAVPMHNNNTNINEHNEQHSVPRYLYNSVRHKS